MRAACLLILLLSTAALVSESQGGFWSSVKKMAKKAVGWVTRHCTVSLSPLGFSCDVSRFRRDVRGLGGSAGNTTQLAALNKLCDELRKDPAQRLVLRAGFSFQMVRDAFDEVEQAVKNSDEVLDDGEFGRFVETLEVLRHCVKREEKSGNSLLYL